MSDIIKRLARIVARKTESDISAEQADGIIVRTLAPNGMTALDLSDAIEREFKVKLEPARLGNMTLGELAQLIGAGGRAASAAPCSKPGCGRPSTTVLSGKAYCDAHLAELRAPAKKDKAAA